MGNQKRMQNRMTRVLGLAVVGALVSVAAPASAACTTAYTCTWDADRDGTADVVYAGASGTSAMVTSTDSLQKAVINGPFTKAQATAWYVDEDGDGDMERIYVGGSALTSAGGTNTGGYASVYMIDRDNGDVIDYASAVIQGGSGPLVIGYSLEYTDPTQDQTLNSPYSRMSFLS